VRFAARLAVSAAILAVSASAARAEPADWIEATIHERAEAHGVSGPYLVRVARCESGLDPFAVGRLGEQGIFQLAPWGEGARFRARGYGNVWSVWEQADFTAARFAEGGARAWSCR